MYSEPASLCTWAVCCCRYFFLNAGILVLGLGAYVIIARNYTEKPVVSKAAAAKQGFMENNDFKAA
jgi:hypothetical protein